MTVVVAGISDVAAVEYRCLRIFFRHGQCVEFRFGEVGLSKPEQAKSVAECEVVGTCAAELRATDVGIEGVSVGILGVVEIIVSYL